MEDWLNTVCNIAANDLGTRASHVQFLLNDYMDLAHEAYNDGMPAASFAVDIVSSLGGWL